VIHAGIYYPKDSLKAHHCVNGARMLYEFCAQHNIPHRRSGKLIVARDEHEVQALEALMARATDNGVQGMELVEQAFIREREPHLKARVALFSPNTGMLNARRWCRRWRGSVERRTRSCCLARRSRAPT
jgi:L-2-hydroxyglutarate oxidase LhgO